MRMKGLSQSGYFPNGTPRFYLRGFSQKAIPMPCASCESDEFRDFYLVASGSLEIPKSIRSILVNCRSRAIHRSRVKGLECSITTDHILEMLRVQGWRCALTDVEFDFRSAANAKRSARRPSIDRIDPSAGYVPGNVRITTVIANIARADFTDEDFYDMCEAVTRTRKERKVPTHKNSNFQPSHNPLNYKQEILEYAVSGDPRRTAET